MKYVNIHLKTINKWLPKLILAGGATALLLMSFVLIWFATLELPDFKSFETRKVIQSTKIYDRTGKVLLYDVHNNIRRTVVPFNQISDNVKKATLAIEDDTFYSHSGVRPLAIVRSLFNNIMKGDLLASGGSTITQQVVKKTMLTDEKKITRKIKEAILAVKMEEVMSKDDIFTLYLNEIPYGGSLYGIEEASLGFFGKHANEVTLAEAAYLASLPQAPSYYSPHGNNRAQLDTRQRLVLSRMKSLGYITKKEYDAAVAEQVNFLPPSQGGIKAPHFVMYVKQLLEAKYGKDVIENDGLKVTTTLDWEKQAKAEEIVAKRAPEIAEKFDAKNIGGIGVDPKTGQVLIMVGSRDYFNVENQGNFNTTIARRQPGSSFKPFVYATAFMKGYTPDTVLFNLRTQFSTACTWDGIPRAGAKQSDCYMPENYDFKYNGPMLMRSALAESVNVVAIKTLYLAGITDSITTAKAMGIQGLADKARYGLTLVLGGGEVSLLNLVEAYGVFANDGVRNPETVILKVEDAAGNVLDEWQPTPERVLPENTARQINDILSDNAARTPAFGANSALYIPERPVAVKTGTTNDYRDVWITGYTPNFALGFWAGNNDNRPMSKKVAGFIIAPIWNEVLRSVLPSLPEEYFVKPEPTPQNIKPILRGLWQGNQEYIVDRTTGNLATEATPEEERVHKVVTDVHSILYWVNKNDPLGPPPSSPSADPQFNLWEPPVQAYVRAQGLQTEDSSVIPTQYDSIHGSDRGPAVTITSPAKDAVFSKGQPITVSFTAGGPYPVKQAAFFMNDTYLGVRDGEPFTFSITPGETMTGKQRITVIAYDSVRNKGEASVDITIK